MEMILCFNLHNLIYAIKIMLVIYFVEADEITEAICNDRGKYVNEINNKEPIIIPDVSSRILQVN